jgi:PTS system nitrogen regulatory IIA component
MYLNVVQLAESFGVEESVVERWVREEGLPNVPDRGRLLFDRAQVAEWAAQRGRAARVGFLAAEGAHLHGGRRLESLLRHGGIWRDLPGAEVFGVLERVITGMPAATPAVRQFLAQRLHVPQAITWAPVGGGFALPHLRAPVALGPGSGTLALLLLRESSPIAAAGPDGVPVNRMLFFIAPSPRAHLELLGLLSRALTRGDLRQRILEGAPDAEIFAALVVVEKDGQKEAVP